MSDAAGVELEAALAVVGVGSTKLDEAVAQSDKSASATASELAALGQASEAARKAEADQLAR